MANASDAPPLGLVTRELVSAPRPPRSPHEIRRVAVEAHRDPRTVEAAYTPGSAVTDLAHASITDAAIRIGFAPPPPRGSR
jgi:hypothetical protein